MTRASPLILLLLLAAGPASAGLASPTGCVTLVLTTQAEAVAIYPILGDSVGVALQAGSVSSGSGLVAFVTPALCHAPSAIAPIVGSATLQSAIPLLP